MEDNFGRGQGLPRTVMPEGGGGGGGGGEEEEEEEEEGGGEEEEINHSGNLHRKYSPVTSGHLSGINGHTQPRSETTVLCRE